MPKTEGLKKWREQTKNLHEKRNKSGKFHNNPGDEFPAVITYDGKKKWYHNGRLHRIDGPAIIKKNGGERWYKHGKMHRDNGPAFTTPEGHRWWYSNGEKHRLDGPACIWPSGTLEWYIKGFKLPFKKWANWVNLSDEQLTILIIIYGKEKLYNKYSS